MPHAVVYPDPGPNSGPNLAHWRELAQTPPEGDLLGRPLAEWRTLTRQELGLATDRPILATGHQTLLWHPGILAKYMALDAALDVCAFASANLIVDQHVGDFGVFEAPIRNTTDGSLDVARVRLTHAQPDVPMGLHPPFEPNHPPDDVRYATDSVAAGVDRIVAAVRSHKTAPDAAIQMARALADLMARWVRPIPGVTATALGATSLAQALIRHMIDNPRRCAETYNRAIAGVPDAGIGPLAVDGGDVEVPLWRLSPGRTRLRARLSDLKEQNVRSASRSPLDATEHSALSTQHSALCTQRSALMPRALFMTALVRLGMCDLFIHGTGGAAYDRAMERWIREWLAVEVAPMAVVTADVVLGIGADGPALRTGTSGSPSRGAESRAVHHARHVWHDPQRDPPAKISDAKRFMLETIARLPRNSAERRRAFHHMHEQLGAMRTSHQPKLIEHEEQIARARRAAREHEIASRRDWAFPLYPESALDALAAHIRAV